MRNSCEMKEKIILFGAGKIGNEAIAYYGKNNIKYICDNSLSLQGKRIEGIEVISFEKLKGIYDKYRIIISVLNPEAIKQIVKMLENNNIKYYFFMDDIDTNETVKNVFTDIYYKKKWGGSEDFYSGYGSHDIDIIMPYIDLLINIIINNDINTICDVGCGDFNIMNIVLTRLLNEGINCDYLGIDVVEKLIVNNNEKYGSDNCHFECMDVSDENVELPCRDLLIVRQVLQHLSNELISVIINKMNGFKYVLVTEHIYDRKVTYYNLDKTTNLFTRVDKMSGVYLEKEPFCCKNIVHLLSVPCDIGIIRTSIIINK